MSKQNNLPVGERRLSSMRAVGVLCLQMFDEGKCTEIKDEIRTIATQDIKDLDWNKKQDFAIYKWYYATQAMFQHGGRYWKTWNKKFQSLLIRNQNKDGSWNYPNINGGVAAHLKGSNGEKIYATTLCSLMLTVYYRYLPSSKSSHGFAAKVSKKANEIEDEEEEILSLFE